MNTVKSLYKVSSYIPLLPIEDAYITGILAKFSKVKHVCFRNMFSLAEEPMPHMCDFINHRKIAYTQINARKLVFVWKRLKRMRC